MSTIKAKVFCKGVNYYTNDIDIGNTSVGNHTILENSINYLNIFQKRHIVQDVWRYTIKVSNGNIQILPIIKTVTLSEFDDRLAKDAIGTRIILLILESPHKSEYAYNISDWKSLTPKAPAQGKKQSGTAGDGIERDLNKVLGKINLPDGDFSFVICEPISYCCSLGVITGIMNNTVRDNVWRTIWNLQDLNGVFVFQDEFIARCATYQPEYIINCCTNFKDTINKILQQKGFENLYETFHPSSNCWARKTLYVTRIIQ